MTGIELSSLLLWSSESADRIAALVRGQVFAMVPDAFSIDEMVCTQRAFQKVLDAFTH